MDKQDMELPYDTRHKATRRPSTKKDADTERPKGKDNDDQPPAGRLQTEDNNIQEGDMGVADQEEDETEAVIEAQPAEPDAYRQPESRMEPAESNATTTAEHRIPAMDLDIFMQALWKKIDASQLSMEKKMDANREELTIINKRLDENIDRMNVNSLHLERKIDQHKEDTIMQFKNFSEVFDKKLDTLFKPRIEQLTEEVADIKEGYGNLKEDIYEFKATTVTKFNDLEAIITVNNDKTQTAAAEIENKITNRIEKLEGANNRININQEILEQEVTMIGRRFEQHEAQVLTKLQETDEQLKTKLKNLNFGEPNIINVMCNGSGPMGERRIPKFRGGSNICDFSLQFQTFKVNAEEKGWYKEGDDIRYLVEECLEGAARDWWNAKRDNIHTYQEFMEALENKYWSPTEQMEIKRRLERDRYNEGGSQNRVEYFLKRVVKARMLKPPMSDEEIVDVLKQHFNHDIARQCTLRGIKGIDDMDQFLTEVDRGDRREREERNNQRQNRNMYQGPEEYHNQTRNNQNFRSNHNNFRGNHQYQNNRGNHQTYGNNNNWGRGRPPQFNYNQRNQPRQYQNFNQGNRGRYNRQTQRGQNFDHNSNGWNQRDDPPHQYRDEWRRNEPPDQQRGRPEERRINIIRRHSTGPSDEEVRTPYRRDHSEPRRAAEPPTEN